MLKGSGQYYSGSDQKMLKGSGQYYSGSDQKMLKGSGQYYSDSDQKMLKGSGQYYSGSDQKMPKGSGQYYSGSDQKMLKGSGQYYNGSDAGSQTEPKLNKHLKSSKERHTEDPARQTLDLPSLKDIARAPFLKAGELISSGSAEKEVRALTPLIFESASDRAQANLMQAIVFEEQVHQLPPPQIPGFSEGKLEERGKGDTVGPSQISISLWAKSYNTSREELINPKTHFPVMIKHLAHVSAVAKSRGLPLTPEWIATLWNSEAATEVTEYGKRVQRYYERFATDPEFNPAR